MQRSTWNREDSAPEPARPAAAAQVRDSIESIAAAGWNALAGTRSACLRHEYFAALEAGGAVGPGTGWIPRYVTLETRDGRLLGAVPLFEKTDSRGEFIFDWSWAAALEQTGRRYYPKLVAAVPFTPIPGPRLLLARGAGDAEARSLVQAVLDLARARDASSVHWLFLPEDERDLLEDFGHLARSGCHFEWTNPGVSSFEEWLGGFTSARRKNVRRERRGIAEAGVRCEWVEGGALDDADISLIHRLYASTYHAHGMDPYLPREFFAELAGRMPESVAVCFARRGIETVAASICLEDERTLYGRYWGAFERIDCLHFEVCYYQGIERALARGLERFHPGVQGEHKLLRGFAPSVHHSAHWLRDADLRNAVARFLVREREAVADYVQEAGEFLPFRSGDQ